MEDRLRKAKEKVQEILSVKEIGPEHETLISLFLSGVKSANVLILSKVELQQLDWSVYKYMHGQYFKDSQLYSLLGKATNWSLNPLIYWKGNGLIYELWRKANLYNYISGFFEKDKKFFRYLSLSHAFKAEVRFIPLFPASKKLDTPFLNTLYDIEIENGKEIQTQVALLKNMNIADFTIEDKESIVREQRNIVAELYTEMLEKLIELF